MEQLALQGREAEREGIALALAASRGAPAAARIRIAGLSGTGKTALLRDTVQGSRDLGWCAPLAGAHLTQEQIPLAVVKRLMANVLTELGAAAPRYVPRLASSKTAGAVEEAFYRLVEGVLIDFPLLLAVDDVQWLDSESERVLTHALALYGDRALTLLVAERGRESRRFGDIAGQDFTLSDLGAAASAAIVRAVFPEAPQDIVASIVLQANGHPLTATILAREARSSGAIPSSIRAAIAHAVDSMEPERREFLQLCSLVEEPIDTRLLRKLLPVDEAAIRRYVGESMPEYLIMEGDEVYFSHAAVAEAVRQTIPIDVPFRKRVLEALRSLGHGSLDEFERIARQAGACGERAVERDALLALARESLIEQAWSSAAGAFARAFAIAEPFDEDFAPSYASYATALIANDQPLKAREVLESALEQASRLLLERGFGELAAAYMAAIWYGEDFGAIPEVFARYINHAITPGDRLALYAVLAFYRAGIMDVAGFEEAKRAALAQGVDPGAAQSLQRLYIGEASLQSRLGNHAAASDAIARASAFPDRRRPERASALHFAKAFVDLQEFGIEPLARYVGETPAAHGDENHLIYDRYVSGYVSIMQGRLDEALLIVEDALMRRIDRGNRRRILSIAAAVAALRREQSPYRALVQEALQSLETNRSESVVPLAAWWAAAIAPERSDDARSIARSIVARVRNPLQPVTLFIPLPLAIYAERSSDEETLVRLADGEFFEDSTRWYRAHSALARGIASTALQRPGAAALLKTAADDLSKLGAPFMSAIAAGYASGLEEGNRALMASAAVGSTARLSPREAQVASLLSGGRSPSEIATRLGLSERTVEYHVTRLRQKEAIGSA